MAVPWPTSGWPTPWPTSVAYRGSAGAASCALQPLAISAKVRPPTCLPHAAFDLSVLVNAAPAGWPGAYKRPARGCLCRHLLPLVGQQPLNEGVGLGGLRGGRQYRLLVALEDRDPVGQIIGVIL